MSGANSPSEHLSPKLVLTVLLSVVYLMFGAMMHAQTYTVLYNFCSQPNCTDGSTPYSSLIKGPHGNLFGTTAEGGNACKSTGCGTVFELTPDGIYSVLYNFKGSPDGSVPIEGLFRDSAGNLYGTTAIGGTGDNGTIFEITTSGSEKVLYRFTGGNDGYSPQGPLVQDSKGNFLGTTYGGGPYYCFEGYTCGTVFELTPKGKLKTIYSFTGGTDDGEPAGRLVLSPRGKLYGTTAQSEDLGPMPGTVFEVTPSGNFTTLYSFLGLKDGGSPLDGLIQDSAGNLYGTTFYGGKLACYDGISNGCGVIFEITETGKERVLYRFGGKADGGYPIGGVVQDAQGNLYGTTSLGGDLTCGNGAGCGVIFKKPKIGKEVVLHVFSGSDGEFPSAALFLDSKGNLYGTTPYGGANNGGVVFQLTP